MVYNVFIIYLFEEMWMMFTISWTIYQNKMNWLKKYQRR